LDILFDATLSELLTAQKQTTKKQKKTKQKQGNVAVA
jgi:hypothetical protein